METEKIISTSKADYLRGLNYDQGWQMKIAEHLYKKAYEGYASDPSQDWYTYTDAGYRWACLRFGRGDIEGALSVITDLLHQAEGNEAFPKQVEAGCSCSITTRLSSRGRKPTRQYNKTPIIIAGKAGRWLGPV